MGTPRAGAAGKPGKARVRRKVGKASHPLLSRRVRRSFKHRKDIDGTVVSWQPASADGAALFRVVHADGDEEDLYERQVRAAAKKFDRETIQEGSILRAIEDSTVVKIKVRSYFGNEQESVAVHRAVALRIVSKNFVRMVQVRLVDKPCRGSRDYFFKLEVALRAVENALAADDNEDSEAESSESSSSDSEAESDGSSDDGATAIAGKVVRRVPRSIAGLKSGQILGALREAFSKTETKSITLGYIRERSTTHPARISNDTYRCTMLRCTRTADI